MKLFIRFIAVACLLAGAVVLMGAEINSSARCTTGVDCNVGNGKPSSVTLDASGVDMSISSTNLLTLTASLGYATFIGADAAGAADTVFDTTGAGTITVGSPDVTGVWTNTDGGETVFGDTSNTFEFKALTTGTATITGGDAAGAANTTFDTTGAGNIDVGSVDVLTVDLVTDGGTCTADGNLTCTGNDMGWAVVAGANTACTTTCTSACVFGVNTAATEADIVDCADATADECLCAGGS